MEISITQFRRELFDVVSKVLNGEPVVVTHKGNRFRLVAENAPDRLTRLTPLQILNPDLTDAAETQMKADMQRAWERDWDTL